MKRFLTAIGLALCLLASHPEDADAFEAVGAGGYGLLVSSDHSPAKAVKGGVVITIKRDKATGFTLYNETSYMKYKIGESEKQYGTSYLLMSKSLSVKKNCFWTGVYVTGGFGMWNKFESNMSDPTDFALTARIAGDIPYVRLELSFEMASIEGANEIFLGLNINLMDL